MTSTFSFILLPFLMDATVTREMLKKVRQVELRTRRLVTDALAGEYHSVFKGRGMDFDEVREYTPGDEVRLIDWNVTARTGTTFIKKLREERELTILLAVDVSASGKFGSQAQSKRELAAEVASVLAFSAIHNRDKVGLLLFTDEVDSSSGPPRAAACPAGHPRNSLPRRGGAAPTSPPPSISSVTCSAVAPSSSSFPISSSHPRLSSGCAGNCA